MRSSSSHSSFRSSSKDCCSGFTLLEVLAAVAMTVVVLFVAVNFYIRLSNAGNAATVLTRDVRRAMLILDQIARDLEEAYLFRKPAEEDPLNHPWLFLGVEDDSSDRASRVKFMTRRHQPRGDEVHELDLAVVAYFLEEGSGGRKELFRWASPRLPETLDREFPRDSEDEGVMLFAEDIASLEFRFMDLDGEWQDTWDSSLMLSSGQLPLAVELKLLLLRPEGEESDTPLGPYVRRVLLPVPSLNLEAILEGRIGRSGRSEAVQEGLDFAVEDDEAEDCVTVVQCIQKHPEDADGNKLLSSLSPAEKNSCWTDIAGTNTWEDCQ